MPISSSGRATLRRCWRKPVTRSSGGANCRERVVSALIEGGFFRMLQPNFLGGAELRPVIFTQVTEALAAPMHPSRGASDRTTAARCRRRIWIARSRARSSARRPAYWRGVRRAHRTRRSRWMAAIASAASGVSPAAAITRAGSARTCRLRAAAARCAPCCSRNPACRCTTSGTPSDCAAPPATNTW